MGSSMDTRKNCFPFWCIQAVCFKSLQILTQAGFECRFQVSEKASVLIKCVPVFFRSYRSIQAHNKWRRRHPEFVAPTELPARNKSFILVEVYGVFADLQAHSPFWFVHHILLWCKACNSFHSWLFLTLNHTFFNGSFFTVSFSLDQAGGKKVGMPCLSGKLNIFFKITFFLTLS